MEDATATRASGVLPTALAGTGAFVPGTLVADRYRIVSLVGRGGMGDVYRAEDLKLGQAVALKFLPAALEADPAARERLLAEVRNARRVSHPNICRVFDIGEMHGRVFLTMEYVDGEDLASLLRRIGRLPAMKTLEVARQLCAGLAAAHERGVLHRDLKPANVMIDGRGQARITDFGLAVEVTSAGSPADIAGTPAYMAPERFTGTAGTVRSDLYALGLILYETCTGIAALKADSFQEWQRAHEASTPARPSALASDVDPAVERVIMRCVEKDPASRPSSAAQIAAALPGGDPLAAAIAAGETPSPELVAASGGEGILPRRQAWDWLLASVIALAVAASSWQWVNLANLAPFDGGPEVLEARARSVLRSLGYDQAPRDAAWWTTTGAAQMRALASRESTAKRFADIARMHPGPLLFTYRQSPAEFHPYRTIGKVLFDDPPPQVPGDALVRLDTLGRLVYLRAVPPARDPAPPSLAAPEPGEADQRLWEPLLAATGLSDAALVQAAPRMVPLVPFDARRAWTGEAGGDAFRIEAASFRGRIVFMQFGGATDDTAGPGASRSGPSPVLAVGDALMILLLAAVAFLARRSVRLGRGDRRAASRFAAFTLYAGLLSQLCSRHWASDLGWVWQFIFEGLGPSLFWAAFVWLAYLALEPLVRRAWPRWLTAWTRLLNGRWRDPLVGRSLLAGAAFGMVMATVAALPQAGGRLLGLRGAMPWYDSPISVAGFQTLDPALAHLSTVLDCARTTSYALLLVPFVGVIRLAVRWEPAVLAVAALSVALQAFTEAQPVPLSIASAGITGVCFVTFLRRYGLLALAIGWTTLALVVSTPWTFDLTKWFAWRPALSALLISGLVLWGFRNVLGGQSALPSGALDK